MKKIISRKQLFKICILLIFLSFVTFSIFLLSNSKLNLKKLFGQVGSITYNNGVFEDYDFYTCVIDNYDKEFGEELGYNSSLTDEQLASISALHCESRNIESTKGIEKITGVAEIFLENNKIRSIDLSGNTLLKGLYISNNYLTEINLEKNVDLGYLDVNNNRLESINLVNNVNLSSLYINNNRLTSLDISNNNYITDLSINGNSFLNLNLDIGQTYQLNEALKIPSSFSSGGLVLNANIVKFNTDENTVTGLKQGNTSINFVIDNITNYSFDITVNNHFGSNSYYINESYNYIFTYTDTDPNLIIGNLNIPSTIDSEINNNILKININGEVKEYTIANYSSNMYDLTKDYIYYKFTEPYNYQEINDSYVANKVAENVTCNNCKIYYDNTTHSFGVRPTDFETDFFKTFKLLYPISSDPIIDFSKDKIAYYLDPPYPISSSNNELILEQNFDSIVAKYNGEVLQTWQIIRPVVNSNKYFVNNEYAFIYTKADSDAQTILSNVWTDSSYELTVNDNKLQLWKEDKIIREYYIVYYESQYDLSNGYLYLKIDELDLSKININNNEYAGIEQVGNKLRIYYGTELWNRYYIEDIEIIRFYLEEYSHAKFLPEKNVILAENVDFNSCVGCGISGNAYIESNNNGFDIKYNGNVIDSFIYKYYFLSDYNMLGNNYMYIGKNDFDLSNNVKTNMHVSYENEKLCLKLDESDSDCLYSYKIINYSVDITGGLDKIKLQTNADKTYYYDGNYFELSYDGDYLETVYLPRINLKNNKFKLVKNYLYVKSYSLDYDIINNSFEFINCNIDYLNDNYDYIMIHSNYGSFKLDIISIESNYPSINDGYILKNGNIDLRVKNGKYETDGNTLIIKALDDTFIDSIDILIMTSQKYDLTKDYIYLRNKKFINDIVFSSDKLSCDEKSDKLVIKYNNKAILTKYFVKINSDIYDIRDNYIYISDKFFNSDNLNVTNGYSKENNKDNNNVIEIYYKNGDDEEKVDDISLAGIKLIYSLDNNYIYLRNKPERIFKDIEYINTILEYSNGRIVIKHKDTNEELEEKELIYLQSSKYNLDDDYIYLGNEKLDKSNISIFNAELRREDNDLNVYYNNELLDTFKLVEISSDVYVINGNNIFITDSFDINKISVTNAETEYKDEVLYVRYDNTEKVFYVRKRDDYEDITTTKATSKNQESDSSNVTGKENNSNSSKNRYSKKTSSSSNNNTTTSKEDSLTSTSKTTNYTGVKTTTIKEKQKVKKHCWLWLIILILIIIGIIIYIKEKKESEDKN